MVHVVFKAQGYKIVNNILFQDNESVIKMEVNGRNSCTGNSRHIEIKYFWVKDRVDRKEVQVRYCPTRLMLADYFTKAIQGSLFNKFRDIIMGYKNIDEILLDPSHPLKERVEIRDLKQNVTGIDESSDKYKQKGVTYADALRKQKGVTCADVLRKQKGVTYTDILRNQKGVTYADVLRGGNKDILGERRKNTVVEQ